MQVWVDIQCYMLYDLDLPWPHYISSYSCMCKLLFTIQVWVDIQYYMLYDLDLPWSHYISSYSYMILTYLDLITSAAIVVCVTHFYYLGMGSHSVLYVLYDLDLPWPHNISSYSCMCKLLFTIQVLVTIKYYMILTYPGLITSAAIVVCLNSFLLSRYGQTFSII